MTNFPFVRPTFVRGVARLFDFASAMNRDAFHDILTRTDEEAIASDWQIVGADMWNAMYTVDEKYRLNLTKHKK